MLAGTIEPSGRGYRICVKATRAVTGDVITSARRAPATIGVLDASTRLMTRVRSGLGDDAFASAQMFAMTTLSATSLDVVRHFATALEAQSNNKFEEAKESLLKAIQLDPRFGIAYQSLAVVSRNLEQMQEAQKYIKQALNYLGGMTERERYNTRGMNARITRDYQQCVSQYGALVERYSADIVGRNGLALCLTQLRRPREALDKCGASYNCCPTFRCFGPTCRHTPAMPATFRLRKKRPSRFRPRSLCHPRACVRADRPDPDR